jgi:hypothetical protein
MAANSNSSSFSGSLLVALATIAFAVLVFVLYGMKGEKAPLVYPKNTPPPPTAATLRAQETEVLTSYGWVDKDKGVVRIPVDKAADLVIEELNK